jgi:hypothetical protein
MFSKAVSGAYFIVEGQAIREVKGKTRSEIVGDQRFFDDWSHSGNVYWRSSGMLWFAPYYAGEKIDAVNITLVDNFSEEVSQHELEIEIELFRRSLAL